MKCHNAGGVRDVSGRPSPESGTGADHGSGLAFS